MTNITEYLPLAADSAEGLIKLVAIVGIMIVIGVIKSITKAREAAEENRRRERQRELERQMGQPPPVQRPMPIGDPMPSQARSENVYYPPTAGQRPSQQPGQPVQSAPRDFGGAVLTSSTTSRPVPVPVPVPRRPTPASPIQRPGQQPPVRQTPAGPATAAASTEASQALQLLKQVDQQIGAVEGNLAKLQARRKQLSALAGVRTRQPVATTAAGVTASSLHLNMRDRSNVRQGIIVSELLRPPIGLREEEGSWAK